jgi:structural maintenance of chromosome 4
MRLNKLNELIHNSSLQDNLRFARVTIFFKEIKDLEDEKFEEVPDSNFVLSREVYKNGSSKYFLNNREINFDSLCTILDKKGIDLKHNRFLILQGEVEQISMMKPKASNPGEVGLLEFLEDIIGTTRYVNLIEKLGKDIDELSEIKTQKSNRVRITKNELDQLEDVKNASTEYYKKEKELHIFGHLDFLLKRHLVNKQILDYQDKIQKITINLGDIDKKISAKVEENSFIIEEHKKIKREQEILKQKRIELNKQTDALDEIDKVKRADIDNFSKNISKAKNALEKLNKNYQNQSENIQNARTELPKKEKEIVELQESKKRNEAYINEKEQELFDKTEKFQIKKREVEKQIQPYEDKINANTFQIEQNNSTINLISQKFDKINNDLKATELRKSECEKVLKDKSEFISQVEVSIRNLEGSLKESRDNLVRANAELDSKYKTTQNLLAKISEIKTSNQERHQKNNILDSLLKAQQEGKLSGIYGRLGDLGVIDAKYDVAITTACSNLDSIVVETVDHAQKCLDFLKKNNIGRATFLILEKIAWVDNNMRASFRTPNNCERLFDLVKYKNQKLSHAFYFALRDTLVAPDLKTASSVAYGSTRHRVVTLNGELIEVSGTMSGGGKPKRVGYVE